MKKVQKKSERSEFEKRRHYSNHKKYLLLHSDEVSYSLGVKSEQLKLSLFFLSSIAICVFIFFPVLTGQPIWDDDIFWFSSPVMPPEFSYWRIWQTFTWPLSTTVQKWLISLWGYRYENYHALNLFLHILNSLLIYEVGKKIRIPYPKWLFLLFLLHPANVISVAWMIQLKTLLCLLFALFSFCFFAKGIENKKWMPLSYLFFLASVLSKSASLSLPLVYSIYIFDMKLRYRWVLVLPFFLISLWGSYRILSSQFTQDSLEVKGLDKIIEKPLVQESAKIPEEFEKKERPKTELIKTELPKKLQENKTSKTEPPKKLQENETLKTKSRFNILIKTPPYYFWQSFFPLKNHPIKGPQVDLSIFDIVGILSLMTLMFYLYPLRSFWIISSGFILLLPFLGILPAPYMNLTWASDQHLYLAIPLFLSLGLFLLNRWIPQLSVYVLCIFLGGYLVKTHEAVSFYKNDETFFKASLKENDENPAIVYNLAVYYANHGRFLDAIKLCNEFMNKANAQPTLKASRYYHELENLQKRLMENTPST